MGDRCFRPVPNTQRGLAPDSHKYKISSESDPVNIDGNRFDDAGLPAGGTMQILLVNFEKPHQEMLSVLYILDCPHKYDGSIVFQNIKPRFVVEPPSQQSIIRGRDYPVNIWDFFTRMPLTVAS